MYVSLLKILLMVKIIMRDTDLQVSIRPTVVLKKKKIHTFGPDKVHQIKP